MAAHAVALTGQPIAIFTKGDEDRNPIKSRLGGAQFLHEPIPGINDADKPDAVITYETLGSVDSYRRKVYGSEPVPFVSMEGLKDGDTQKAWNLINTYDRLWDLLGGGSVNTMNINTEWLDNIIEGNHFKLIFNTIPAPLLCRSQAGKMPGEMVHKFESQTIRIANYAMMGTMNDNTVIYNGDPDYSWYRCSKLFGVEGTEWSDNAPIPPIPEKLITARKPVRTNCDCYAEHVIRLGRHGTWTKGVLTHHAFTLAHAFATGQV